MLRTVVGDCRGEGWQCLPHKTATTLSWSNGFVQSFNIAIPVVQATSVEHPLFKALVAALQNIRTQVMQNLPAQAMERISNLLMNYHPLHRGDQLPYFCSKTFGRLCGNASLMAWVNSNMDMAQPISSFNGCHSIADGSVWTTWNIKRNMKPKLAKSTNRGWNSNNILAKNRNKSSQAEPRMPAPDDP